MGRAGWVVVSVAAIGVGLLARGAYEVVRPRWQAVPVPDPKTHDADVSRGEHLVRDVLGCGSCHGDDLGGALVPVGGVVGDVWATNLTAAGPYGDADLEAWTGAIRHGVSASGDRLVGMPARRWANLSDGDLLDVVAALRARPPVARVGPDGPSAIRRAAAVAVGWGALVEPAGGPMPAPSPSVAYGTYLGTVAGCDACHGGGGPLGPEERATGTLDLDASWTGATFGTALRGPIGHASHRRFVGLTDLELDALWWRYRASPDEGIADARLEGP